MYRMLVECFLLAHAFFFLLASSADPCRLPKMDVVNAVRNSEIVFEGSLKSQTRAADSDNRSIFTFQTIHFYKGYERLSTAVDGIVDSTDQISVVSEKYSLKSTKLRVGSKYLVFVKSYNTLSHTGMTIVNFVMVSTPAKANKLIRSIARTYGCTTCTEKPVGTVKLKVSSRNIKESRKINLKCSIHGPATLIPGCFVWLKDGRQLERSQHVIIANKKSRSKLLIKKAKVKDEGRYSCVVKDFLGNETSTSVDISVRPLTKSHASLCGDEHCCLNGGVCWESLGNKFCECRSGYTGNRCHDKDYSELYALLRESNQRISENQGTLSIIAVVLSTVTCLLVIVGLYCSLRQHCTTKSLSGLFTTYAKEDLQRMERMNGMDAVSRCGCRDVDTEVPAVTVTNINEQDYLYRKMSAASRISSTPRGRLSAVSMTPESDPGTPGLLTPKSCALPSLERRASGSVNRQHSRSSDSGIRSDFDEMRRDRRIPKLTISIPGTSVSQPIPEDSNGTPTPEQLGFKNDEESEHLLQPPSNLAAPQTITTTE